MSDQPETAEPNQPQDPRHETEDAGGVSLGIVVAVLLAASAGIIFWAGMSLGGQSMGRDAGEQRAIESFAETYRIITDQYVGEADSDALLEAAIEGMFGTLDDPYSAYMAPDEYAATFDDINGRFEGIGARMHTEDADGQACEPIDDACWLRVVEVLPEAPALAAGLLAEDVVKAVDGRALDGATIDDAVLLIRGPRGSEVTLSIERGGEPEELKIKRDTVITQDVRTAVLADGQVGYLRIDSFSGAADSDFDDALETHLENGIDQLIVDVRDDPGGFVDTAVAITSQFIGDGPAFWEEDADGDQRSIDVVRGGRATDPDIEIVVLVNSGSASASEILAGALQDAQRATLVGTPTFGKGTVQEWTQLPGESGGFRLSVAKWLTRDKHWVHGSGLVPDVAVDDSGFRLDPTDGSADGSADAQLQAGLETLLGRESSSPSPSVVPDPRVSRAPVR